MQWKMHERQLATFLRQFQSRHPRFSSQSLSTGDSAVLRPSTSAEVVSRSETSRVHTPPVQTRSKTATPNLARSNSLLQFSRGSPSVVKRSSVSPSSPSRMGTNACSSGREDGGNFQPDDERFSKTKSVDDMRQQTLWEQVRPPGGTTPTGVQAQDRDILSTPQTGRHGNHTAKWKPQQLEHETESPADSELVMSQGTVQDLKLNEQTVRSSGQTRSAAGSRVSLTRDRTAPVAKTLQTTHVNSRLEAQSTEGGHHVLDVSDSKEMSNANNSRERAREKLVTFNTSTAPHDASILSREKDPCDLFGTSNSGSKCDTDGSKSLHDKNTPVGDSPVPQKNTKPRQTVYKNGNSTEHKALRVGAAGRHLSAGRSYSQNGHVRYSAEQCSASNRDVPELNDPAGSPARLQTSHSPSTPRRPESDSPDVYSNALYKVTDSTAHRRWFRTRDNVDHSLKVMLTKQHPESSRISNGDTAPDAKTPSTAASLRASEIRSRMKPTLRSDDHDQTADRTKKTPSKTSGRHTRDSGSSHPSRMDHKDTSASDTESDVTHDHQPTKHRRYRQILERQAGLNSQVNSLGRVIQTAHVFSKAARRRALTTMMDENNADLRKVIRREKVRKLQSRASLLRKVMVQFPAFGED